MCANFFIFWASSDGIDGVNVLYELKSYILWILFASIHGSKTLSLSALSRG